MTSPTATLPRPEPVMVTIGRHRPVVPANRALPVPVQVPAIGKGEFRIIGDVDDDVAQAAECNCSAGDDNPY
ncbi:hypothetical protein ADK57_38910 [Streptomyces sp. MMG1533]|uniref:hypothetical protein n=1 Tax=Streptomyces sp. MMG1533 TaxID=1415546 RepID=UPI0006AEABE9|nr:hypothetical protein [Streptomyces sp. MMG1533]KOU57552.1 hypothetical protein ADK57_38910 [Streptomyces sp. MMG1533]